VDSAGRCERIVKADAVAQAQAIDEYGYVLAQMALLVQHVAAQLRVSSQARTS